MTRIQMVAAHAAIMPKDMLWAELMADTEDNRSAVRICRVLKERNEL